MLLFKSLTKSQWVYQGNIHESMKPRLMNYCLETCLDQTYELNFAGMPMTEKLSFILTTLLCDVAVLLDESDRNQIVTIQLEVLQRLSESITETVSTPHVDQHKKGWLPLNQRR